MKRLILAVVVLTLVLAGCAPPPILSGNSDDDIRTYTRTWSKDRVSDTDIASPHNNEVKLVEINVDSHDSSTTNFSPCPLVQTAGDNSCNIQFFTSQDTLQEMIK